MRQVCVLRFWAVFVILGSICIDRPLFADATAGLAGGVLAAGAAAALMALANQQEDRGSICTYCLSSLTGDRNAYPIRHLKSESGVLVEDGRPVATVFKDKEGVNPVQLAIRPAEPSELHARFRTGFRGAIDTGSSQFQPVDGQILYVRTAENGPWTKFFVLGHDPQSPHWAVDGGGKPAVFQWREDRKEWVFAGHSDFSPGRLQRNGVFKAAMDLVDYGLWGRRRAEH